jgi:hypothetical protein
MRSGRYCNSFGLTKNLRIPWLRAIISLKFTVSLDFIFREWILRGLTDCFCTSCKFFGWGCCEVFASTVSMEICRMKDQNCHNFVYNRWKNNVQWWGMMYRPQEIWRPFKKVPLCQLFEFSRESTWDIFR